MEIRETILGMSETQEGRIINITCGNNHIYVCYSLLFRFYLQGVVSTDGSFVVGSEGIMTEDEMFCFLKV